MGSRIWAGVYLPISNSAGCNPAKRIYTEVCLTIHVATGNVSDLYREHVEKELSICSRCFRPSQTTAQRSSAVSGEGTCGDDCGTLSASLDGMLSTDEFLSRGARLCEILESNTSLEIDDEAFERAIRFQSSGSREPRNVFITAIEHAAGISEMEELTSNDITGTERKVIQKLLRGGPVPTSKEFAYQDAAPDVDRVSVFPVMGRDSAGVYYLQDVESFETAEELADRCGLDSPYMVQAHSPREVVRVAIYANEQVFWDASPAEIDHWIERTDEKFRTHILPVAYEKFNNDEGHFRTVGFWSVLEPAPRKVLQYLRDAPDEGRTPEEIVETVGVESQRVNIILRQFAEDGRIEVTDEGGETMWRVR